MLLQGCCRMGQNPTNAFFVHVPVLKDGAVAEDKMALCFKYYMEFFNSGYYIASINNLSTSKATQLLSTRRLRTYRKGKCFKKAVHVTDNCAAKVKCN